jgi:hypothetical protein
MTILDMGWLLPVTVVLLVITCVLYRLDPPEGARGSLPLALVLLFVVPVATLWWAAISYGAESGIPPGGIRWRSAILFALGLGHMATASAVLYRYRRWILLPAILALLSLVWFGLSWFVGTMAIANDWI